MENKSKFEAIGATLLLALLTPGLGFAQTKTPEKPKMQVPAASKAITVSANTAVLSASEGKALFPDGTKYWTPKPADIAHLEADLPKLAKNTYIPHAGDRPNPPGILTYYRQYIGIVQDGKQVLYVNAFAASLVSDFPNWRHQTYIVNDGGAGFYHVTYNVKTRRFDTLQFNGYA